MQSLLAAQGTNPGPADGVFGARTRAAIKQWQSAKGYQATGVLMDEQVRALIVAGQQAQAQAQAQQTQQAATTARKKTKKDLWGSIAFSKKADGGMAYAIVWNSGGREPARNRAKTLCRGKGGSNCAELGWFRNACGALALGDTGAGAGWGTKTTEAESMALSECRSAGNTNCKIEVSRCTDKGFETAGAEKKPAVAEKKAVAKLSPMCSYDVPGGEFCWREIDDQPGCHVYQIRDGRPPFGHGAIRGRGECRGGVIVRGTLSIESGALRAEGTYVDGKKTGRWVEKYVHGDDMYHNSIHTGSYVDGKKTGRWEETKTNDPTGWCMFSICKDGFCKVGGNC